MRITNKTMVANMLRNLSGGLGRMDGYQKQLASGKRIQLPSDDPAGITNVLHLRSSIVETGQFIDNADTAVSWLDAVDTVLDEVTQVVHRAKELAVYGANDALDPASREALAREVEQLFQNTIQLGNSSFSGRYMFSGQTTSKKPFALAEDGLSYEYQGGSGPIEIELFGGSRLPVNIVVEEDAAGEPQEAVFSGILDTLIELRDNLVAENGGSPDQLDGTLEHLDQSLDTLLRHRSDVGAKMNRVELAGERLKDLEINLNQLISKEQDVDVAEAIMQLTMEENVYRTALSVGARIIQPTLVDFLR